MTRFTRKLRGPAGAAPGTLTAPDSEDLPLGRVTVMVWGESGLVEEDASDMNEALSRIKGEDTGWIHVRGLMDQEMLTLLGSRFNIHPLTLEDIANSGHRPKFESFEDYFFLVLKQIGYDREAKMITSGQISLIVAQGLLISFKEKDDGVLEPVRKRLRAGRGIIRTAGPGYLAYALADAVVDHYFHALWQIGDDIEGLETRMLDHIDPSDLDQIHGFRREMIFFNRMVWPLREAVSTMIKSESDLIPDNEGRFINDVYDHVVHILDTMDSLRELLAGMLDFHMSSTSNRMNQVMGTLTIIATIFIPLTFLAGIYGMNFKYMPELDWKWSYFILMGIMAALATAMLVYFKRKNWF